MAVNLFSHYYDNPDKQYLYTKLTCSNASTGDKIFSISNDKATITDGATTLADLNIGDIQEYLTQFKNETRTIEPYDFVFIKGFSNGATYQRSVFLFVPDKLMDDEDFPYLTGINFYVDYYKNGVSKRANIYGIGDFENKESFIDATQEVLDNNQLPINISLDGNLIVFTGTNTGYEFHIGSEEHPNAIRIFSTDVDGYGEDTKLGVNALMYDYCPAYIPPYKYKNGAFKGIVIKPTYPQYNADSIQEGAKALKLAFMPNRVEMLLPVKVDNKLLYDKRCFTVLGDYSDMIEKQQFDRWRDVDTTRPCDNEILKESLAGRNTIGLYGFIDWVYEHNQWEWLNTGSLYINLAPTDSADTAERNLIPSFVIYNPNPFPVQVSCMLYE